MQWNKDKQDSRYGPMLRRLASHDRSACDISLLTDGLQWVTGQLADTPTRGLPTRGLDISRTGQLAVWQMPPKRKTKRAKSPMASASCPVRDLSSPRVVQSASWQSASWRIRELSSNPSHDRSACDISLLTDGLQSTPVTPLRKRTL